MKIELEPISPSVAQSIIETSAATGIMVRGNPSSPKNRSTAKYARDMAAGRWDSDNVATIQIGPRGELWDGNHRMWAIIRSRSTIPMWVARGVPKHAVIHMDSGKRRSISDLLNFAGIKNAKYVGTLGALLWKTKYAPSSYYSQDYASPAEIYETTMENLELIQNAISFGRSLKLIVPKTYSSLLWAIHDPEAIAPRTIDDFAAAIIGAQDENAVAVNGAAGTITGTTFRNWAVTRRNRQGISTPGITWFKMLAKTWNNWCNGVTMKMLRLPASPLMFDYIKAEWEQDSD